MKKKIDKEIWQWRNKAAQRRGFSEKEWKNNDGLDRLTNTQTRKKKGKKTKEKPGIQAEDPKLDRIGNKSYKFLEQGQKHYTSSQLEFQCRKLDEIFAKFPKISENSRIYLEAIALLVPICSWLSGRTGRIELCFLRSQIFPLTFRYEIKEAGMFTGKWKSIQKANTISQQEAPFFCGKVEKYESM